METSESPASLLAEGRYRFSSGDHEGSIELYTAAICLSRITSRRIDAAINGGGVTSEDERVAAEVKETHFRCLSRRSEARLALKIYKDAYTDANAALALVDDSTKPSSRGLLQSDIDLAHDFRDRAMAGVLGLDDHLDLDNMGRTKAKYILENPQEPVRFVPGSREEAILYNSELRLEDMQDDLSVLTPGTGFPGSSRTMGTMGTASARRWRLDPINEDPNTTSPSSSQRRSSTGHQVIEPPLPRLSSTADKASPKDKSAPSASVNAAAHSKHLFSTLTSTVIKPLHKFKRGLNKRDQYEYAPRGPQTKELGVIESSRPDSSSTSSLNSSSIDSQSPPNANTTIQETNRGESSRLMSASTVGETSENMLSSQQGSISSSHQTIESSNASTSLKLEDVVELYESFNIEFDYELVVDALKMALFQCNGTTRNIEVAMFCLNKLLFLAPKTEEIKSVMISGDTDSALVAIIETARFHPDSVEIQQEVCGLLWTLFGCVDLPALSTKFTEHVAFDNGCKAILDAMSRHRNIDTLQARAMKALKILSFHDVCKSALRAQGGVLNVAEAMLSHQSNLPIQSTGCEILKNLVADESSQSAALVCDELIESLLKGMLNHPSSKSVHRKA
jgi:hypothetical protein